MKAGMEVLFGTKHEMLSEAVIADIIDGIPIIGDISNAIRAAKEEDERRRAAQVADTLLGTMPEPLGIIADILTPTNMMIYLNRKYKKT